MKDENFIRPYLFRGILLVSGIGSALMFGVLFSKVMRVQFPIKIDDSRIYIYWPSKIKISITNIKSVEKIKDDEILIKVKNEIPPFMTKEVTILTSILSIKQDELYRMIKQLSTS